MPRVGVVLSSYNRPDGLLAAVDSLVAQEYRDWCCVVADDGSEDERVVEVLRQLRADPRFDSVRGRPRTAEEKRRVCTLSLMINVALDRLRARDCELYCYLLDDVVYHPGRLAAHVAFLDSRSDVSLVWGEQWLEEYDEAGALVRARHQVVEQGLGERTMTYIRSRLWVNNFINHCSATHRRTDARWDERPSVWQRCDHAYWQELLRRGAVFHHVPVVGETMRSGPWDIGPVLQGGGTIADVVRRRGGA